MTIVMLELPPDLYGKLEKVAAQEAKQPAEWTRAVLEERLAAMPAEEGERARAHHALREAGMLVELAAGAAALAATHRAPHGISRQELASESPWRDAASHHRRVGTRGGKSAYGCCARAHACARIPPRSPLACTAYPDRLHPHLRPGQAPLGEVIIEERR